MSGAQTDVTFTFSTTNRHYSVYVFHRPGDYGGASVVGTPVFSDGAADDTVGSITPSAAPGTLFTVLTDEFTCNTVTAPTNYTMLQNNPVCFAAAREHAAAFDDYADTSATGELTWGGSPNGDISITHFASPDASALGGTGNTLFCPESGVYVITDELVCGTTENCCPPVLSTPTISNISDSDADVTVVTNKAGGTITACSHESDQDEVDCDDIANDVENICLDRKSKVAVAGSNTITDVGGMFANDTHQISVCHDAWDGRPIARAQRRASAVFTTSGSGPPPPTDGDIQVIEFDGVALPSDLSISNSNTSLNPPNNFSNTVTPPGIDDSWAPYVEFDNVNFTGFRNEVTPKDPAILRMDLCDLFYIRFYLRTGPNWGDRWRSVGNNGNTFFQVHGAPDQDLGESAGRNPNFALRIADYADGRTGAQQFTASVQGSAFAVNSKPKDPDEYEAEQYNDLNVDLETWFRVDIEYRPSFNAAQCAPRSKVTINDGTEDTVFFEDNVTLTAFNDAKAPFAKAGQYAIGWKIFRPGQPANGTQRQLFFGAMIFGRNTTWAAIDAVDPVELAGGL